MIAKQNNICAAMGIITAEAYKYIQPYSEKNKDIIIGLNSHKKRDYEVLREAL